MQTDNLRIAKTRPLISPAVLEEEIPLLEPAADLVSNSRRTIADIVQGRDQRLLVVVGPCSIHDVDAALEYADRIRSVAEQVRDELFCVMRVYFEKPRTVIGWKGMINDPGLDHTYRINQGLRQARSLLARIAAMGLPSATEFLDTTFGQYYTDLISWGAVGARTVESQIHRELASGLSMPVGIKNRTDGDLQVAIDAIRAASHRHLFPSLTKEGAPAILETTGNPDCHLVMRGGRKPNFDAGSIAVALDALTAAGVNRRVMIDCSHGNSRKNPHRQIDVASDVTAQRLAGNGSIAGLMLESHLLAGRQDIGPDLTYGQSITDACLGFEETRELLLRIAGRLSGH